jgi:predicted glycoside hydrolase/deacetylase ChbG (UPF0249 family)
MRRLGLRDDDRAVIIHLDDVGMCQATLTAYADLLDFGLVSSAAVMVPCGWFPAVASFCRAHPAADMGVHITLTSEWDSYRWGPISTADPASGLIDGEGYFHRTRADAQAHGDPQAAAAEMEAQVARALAAGVDVTHIDTHMGTVAHVRFAAAYVHTARQHNLPAMVSRWDAERLQQERGVDDTTAHTTSALIRRLEETGFPLIDHMDGMPLEGDKPLALALAKFAALQPGLTHFILHAAVDTPELRAITPDWPARVADYELFTSPALRDFIRDQGIHVIGYRPLRDLLRS